MDWPGNARMASQGVEESGQARETLVFFISDLLDLFFIPDSATGLVDL